MSAGWRQGGGLLMPPNEQTSKGASGTGDRPVRDFSHPQGSSSGSPSPGPEERWSTTFTSLLLARPGAGAQGWSYELGGEAEGHARAQETWFSAPVLSAVTWDTCAVGVL